MITLTITGCTSIIHSNFTPPLNLEDGNYECGLLYFSAFNSIPNITSQNNVFCYGDDNKCITIPCGLYDLHDIDEYLQQHMNKSILQILPNNNTLSCRLFCSETINFNVTNTIGKLLGFPKVKLEANKWHESTHPVNILPVAVIRIECDLVKGSYTNGVPTHNIYEFIPNVPPGHKFVEVPQNVVYYPINKKYISDVTIKVLDLKGNYIDFRSEDLQVSLHIRKSK